MPSWTRYFASEKRFEVASWIYDQFDVWDAHTHLGHDRDGTVSTPRALMQELAACCIQKAVVFPLDDPADQSFTASNNAVYALAKQQPRLFIPFFRLNPHAGWKRELRRRVEEGFAGIKLHPRAQRFGIASPTAVEIYAAAERHELPVLLHTGHGLDEVSASLERVIADFRQLRIILGHAAFVDLNRTIEKMAASPYVLFETSTVSVLDLYNVMERVDRRSIVFGSDAPYVSCEFSLEALVHVAGVLNVSMRDLGYILAGTLQQWFV